MEVREQRDTQGLNLRFCWEACLKQFLLKSDPDSEDAGNKGARAKRVFLTLIELSIIKLKQLQFRDSTTGRWLESGLVNRSVCATHQKLFVLGTVACLCGYCLSRTEDQKRITLICGPIELAVWSNIWISIKDVLHRFNRLVAYCMRKSEKAVFKLNNCLNMPC